jgi:quinol---cytochrome-c reductase cytochrome b subunit
MSAGRALEGAGRWLDDRFRGARGVRTFARKVFPDHWTFLLGEIALYSFIILLLTGTFLTLFFQPSMNQVVYHGTYHNLDGVRMSEAYASTLNISFDVRGGLLIRQIHHWAADLFLAAIMAHMIRHFFTGSYRKPREVNWLIGVVMFALALFEGLFGYSLPDDLSRVLAESVPPAPGDGNGSSDGNGHRHADRKDHDGPGAKPAVPRGF